MTQREQILARLKMGPATSRDLQQLGICSHTARVSDLRKAGYAITWVKKRGIVTYTLEGHAVEVPPMPPVVPSAALQRFGLSKCANPPCGLAFQAKRKKQRYCSAKCRFEDWERQHPRLNFSTGDQQISTAFADARE